MNTNFYFLPAHYCRYIDDIFRFFDCLENVEKFFNIINNLLPCLRFNHEIEPLQLAFLDNEIHLPSVIEPLMFSDILI